MGYKSDINKADRISEAEEFPTTLLIDNCSACNLRCSMCDHHNIKKYRKVEIMDFDLYTKIIDEVAEVNPDTRIWMIFFGDPFMCRDMAKRIQYAKDKGLTDVVLNSNGVLMKPEKARAFIKAGLDSMYVGIDAANPETYEQIRVGGDYEKAVANVLSYRDILKQEGRPDQQLFVQFVVSDINEDQVENFKNFWTGQGINVKIRPKISWAGLIKATNLHSNADVIRKPCYWLMQTMNICADGRVALCSVDLHCRVDSGNVVENSLQEVWAKGKLKTYRTIHKEGRFEELPSMCRECSDWQSGYAEFVSKQG